jgi:hypothetical protein
MNQRHSVKLMFKNESKPNMTEIAECTFEGNTLTNMMNKSKEL